VTAHHSLPDMRRLLRFSAHPYGTCGSATRIGVKRKEAQTRRDRRRDVLLIGPDQSSDSLREWSRARSALEVLVTLLRR